MEAENSLVVDDNSTVVPGEFIGPSSKFLVGPGCYSRSNNIYSLLVGKVSISRKGETNGEKATVSVIGANPMKTRTPTVGCVVVCKVTNVSDRQAKVQIVSINECFLQEPFHGIIRREDIRAMEKDSVEVFQSFRPRDIVRGRVIAHGEGQTYLVSTAENELGLVWAQCGCGRAMQPVSWCEMQCTKGDREKRKVAKVVGATLL